MGQFVVNPPRVKISEKMWFLKIQSAYLTCSLEALQIKENELVIIDVVEEGVTFSVQAFIIFKVTASGDQTACLWDVESQQSKATFCGHTCSIKSISYSALDPYLWSTASRDGNIFIWDIRTVGLQKSETMLYNPAMSILFAHSPESFRKKRKTYPFPVRSKPTSSVTGAQFLKHDENLLASSGALDNIIKYWDLRKLSNLRHANPVQVSISGATARRPHGISTLLINNDGSRLYANSTDNYVYMYDALNLGAPLTRFTAPDFRCSSFYVRMAISPDDQYIACGSTDKNIYIWEVDYPDVSPIVLKGHENEVTSLTAIAAAVEEVNNDQELAEVADVFVKEDEKRRSLKEIVFASA
ncbi:6058_t:CDS:2 [Entrophospora sp. SA101]|nr:6058_t:CDS:2 [Entrophospora sp. SA101]